jgi:hypothetical protein
MLLDSWLLAARLRKKKLKKKKLGSRKMLTCALSFELKVGEEKVCALGELDSAVCSSSEGLFGKHSRKDWRGVGGQRSDGGGSGQKDDLSEHVRDELDRW